MKASPPRNLENHHPLRYPQSWTFVHAFASKFSKVESHRMARRSSPVTREQRGIRPGDPQAVVEFPVAGMAHRNSVRAARILIASQGKLA